MVLASRGSDSNGPSHVASRSRIRDDLLTSVAVRVYGDPGQRAAAGEDGEGDDGSEEDIFRSRRERGCVQGGVCEEKCGGLRG